LSWPFAGILFWWCAGRGIEALQGTRRSVVSPRLTWAETGFAVVLLLIGLATLIGIVTSTPDDRRDVQFLALVAGGLLWGILAAITVTARVFQWRILKRNGLLA
jgi:di/tricarboxylate transporter